MTKACNRAQSEQIPRQAMVEGGDCIVCMAEKPDGSPLEVIQVIEGIAHHREDERIDLPFLMVVHNSHRTEAARLRVVHRASVTASLRRFRFHASQSSAVEGWEGRDPRHKQMMDTLRALYAGRLHENPDEPGTALFWGRMNCLGVHQKAIKLSLNGPDGCFGDTDELSLPPEFPQEETPSYCSFLLPPVAPRQTELFVLWLTLEGKSYRRLIGDSGIFTVDSCTRLLRQIKAFDLEVASAKGRDFYYQYIEPKKSLISPAAYDVVILQGEMGDPIAVEDGSICILQVQPEIEHLARQVLWFFGQPDEFYLILRYESAETWKPATTGFVVSQTSPGLVTSR